METQVAANVALRDYPEGVRQILIVDCDVHQGNGNAVLFESNPAVFTFSIHCKANYFSEKQVSTSPRFPFRTSRHHVKWYPPCWFSQQNVSNPTPALATRHEQESDLDVEVEDGAGDEQYLALLSERLPALVDQVRPDLIFYQVRIMREIYDSDESGRES